MSKRLLGACLLAMLGGCSSSVTPVTTSTSPAPAATASTLPADDSGVTDSGVKTTQVVFNVPKMH
ncbi:MAG: hypothetical protein HZA46_21510 [Planctomycetales bacterium]|nr:hypothetical protein [Planctomycetales bacterium]